jgi:hypothetical protein
MPIDVKVPTTQYGNIGVDMSVGEHKDLVLNGVRAGWLDILDNNYRTVMFDGLTRKGEGRPGTMAVGGIINIVVVTLNDNRWTDHGKRKREISYTLAYDIHVDIINTSGTDAAVQDIKPPVAIFPTETTL